MADKTMLCYGGGRQTVAILALCALGEYPFPDYVVFADAGWDDPETYDYMHRHMIPLLNKNDVPFNIVQGKTARGHTDLYSHMWDLGLIPSPIDRSCTDHFKVRPLRKFKKNNGVLQEWIGFSLDEQNRAANTLLKNKTNKHNIIFPLIELKISSGQCDGIIQSVGLPVPLKSACIFCSFQNPWRVRDLYRRHSDLFDKVGELEAHHREIKGSQGKNVYYIIGDQPWSSFRHIQLPLLEDDFNYGCQDGYCLR